MRASRVLTPFNVIAALLLAAVLAVRWAQARPAALAIDPAILAFERGPQGVELPLRLYFANPNGQDFAVESRTASLEGGGLADQAALAVREWIAGPRAQGALPLVPNDIASPTVFARRDTIVIDLPRAWANVRLGSAGELLMLCGLANGVLELKGVSAVQYLLEGAVVESVGGHVLTREPFTVKTCRGG